MYNQLNQVLWFDEITARQEKIKDLDNLKKKYCHLLFFLMKLKKKKKCILQTIAIK